MNKDCTNLSKPLHLKTPLLWSPVLSEKTGMDVWLKLENTQNAASYKIRGIGLMCQQAVQKGCTHIVSSSGGNAGIAAAYAAKLLKVPCTVVVPEVTPAFMVVKMKRLGANVEVVGLAWDEANQHALEIAKNPGHVLMHPFDHPDIWDGYSTMMDEIMEQLDGTKPDVVILSVGGGGLLSGILKGMHHYGLNQVPLIAMETEGAASFSICVKSKQHLALDKIDTIARTLGAKKVCKKAFEWIAEHESLFSHLVSDKQAVEACLEFANDHRFLVSPACGASLAFIYSGLLASMQKDGSLPSGKLQVVVIVCGGNEVDLKELDAWATKFDLKPIV